MDQRQLCLGFFFLIYVNINFLTFHILCTRKFECSNKSKITSISKIKSKNKASHNQKERQLLMTCGAHDLSTVPFATLVSTKLPRMILTYYSLDHKNKFESI